MYLVELRPGKEELYRTGDELAAAIRSGDVDTHSRIYHRATSKWISVTLHPQYKAIVAEQRPAEPPLPPLERATWTFFNDSADELAGAHDPEPAAPEETSDRDGGDLNLPWRRPLALSVTGGLLILGLQLAASGPRPPWSVHEASAAPWGSLLPVAEPASRPAAPTVSLAASWMDDDAGFVRLDARTPEVSAPAAPPAVAPADPAPLLPAAPKIRASALLRAALPKPRAASAEAVEARSVKAMVQRWTGAHDAARARLESGLRVARLNQLFGTGRLQPGGGVTETRMSLAGAANFVRVFRQQQTAIDREYQEAFGAASKEHGWDPADVRVWYARPSAKESPALAALTSSLLEGMDSLLGVLDAQAGTYAVTKNTIRFEDAGAARAYSAVRARIAATVDSARAAGGRDQPGPMSYLLQAIGATRLPLAT